MSTSMSYEEETAFINTWNSVLSFPTVYSPIPYEVYFKTRDTRSLGSVQDCPGWRCVSGRTRTIQKVTTEDKTTGKKQVSLLS